MKKGEAWDGGEAAAREYRFVTGAPYERDVAKSVSEEPRICEPGFLNCGCSEDTVLLEAALRKVTRVKSDNSGALETWQGKHMNPRDRLFLSTIFTDWTGLSVDDLYQFDAQGKPRTYANVLDKQIHILQMRRKNLDTHQVKPSNAFPEDCNPDDNSDDRDLLAELMAEARTRDGRTAESDMNIDFTYTDAQE